MTTFVCEEQTELYERALTALHRAGRQSEYHKPATTREEVELMKVTTVHCTAARFSSPQYKNGQFEMIFANPLSTTAYIHDLSTGAVEHVQVWNEPGELLNSLMTFEEREGIA